jgi:hypothetical protein
MHSGTPEEHAAGAHPTTRALAPEASSTAKEALNSHATPMLLTRSSRRVVATRRKARPSIICSSEGGGCRRRCLGAWRNASGRTHPPRDVRACRKARPWQPKTQGGCGLLGRWQHTT